MDNSVLNAIETTSDINQLAKELALMLKQAEEFQELLRMGHLVNLDPDVRRLIQQIRYKESNYSIDDRGESIEALKAQLEELPAYQAYLKSEEAARDLFRSVNQVISSIAGIDFAENSRPQGCGCGG